MEEGFTYTVEQVSRASDTEDLGYIYCWQKVLRRRQKVVCSEGQGEVDSISQN
jgi:hypothetical protein